jgi:hypothetical protein
MLNRRELKDEQASKQISDMAMQRLTLEDDVRRAVKKMRRTIE